MHLLESQSTVEQPVHRPTPVRIMDPGSVTPPVNTVVMPPLQPQITPVSFASTTQVRMDTHVPPTVNPIVPSVSVTRVPLLQNNSVVNAVNLASQVLSPPAVIQPAPTVPAHPGSTEKCRKCGKTNHIMDRCCTKITCRR